MIELDKIEHVEETIISLGDYLMSSFKKGIIKGMAKRRKTMVLDVETPRQLMLWNVGSVEPP